MFRRTPVHDSFTSPLLLRAVRGESPGSIAKRSDKNALLPPSRKLRLEDAWAPIAAQHAQQAQQALVSQHTVQQLPSVRLTRGVRADSAQQLQPAKSGAWAPAQGVAWPFSREQTPSAAEMEALASMAARDNVAMAAEGSAVGGGFPASGAPTEGGDWHDEYVRANDNSLSRTADVLSAIRAPSRAASYGGQEVSEHLSEDLYRVASGVALSRGTPEAAAEQLSPIQRTTSHGFSTPSKPPAFGVYAHAAQPEGGLTALFRTASDVARFGSGAVAVPQMSCDADPYGMLGHSMLRRPSLPIHVPGSGSRDK